MFKTPRAALKDLKRQRKVVLLLIRLFLLFLEDEPTPPDCPDPSDKEPAGKPLNDSNDESTLFHLVVGVDDGSEDCSESRPENNVNDEEDDSKW